MSSKIFDNYFDVLDPNMLFFTTANMKTFETYRFQLDNVLRSGNLDVPFEIYNVFHQQFISRHHLLDQLLSEIDSVQQNGIPRKTRPGNRSEQRMKWKSKILEDIKKEMQNEKTFLVSKEIVRSRYIESYKKHMEYTNEEVFQWFLYAFTTTYDPHTWYSSPARKQREKIQMSLTFGGIGVTIAEQDNYPLITQTSVNGPAHRSGQVQSGDRILAFVESNALNFQSLEGWSINKVVKNVRGEIGSKLVLVISHQHEPMKLDTVELVREEIKLKEQAATGEIIEINEEGRAHRFAVITIPSFYRDYDAFYKKKRDFKSLTGDVKKILDSLTQYPIGGVLLDLRGNGGGYLSEAIELTDLFISDGTIVQVRNTDGSIKKHESPDQGKVYYNGPLAVLIDRKSASASEIFAGAIQDHGRGLVFGERSFGKGTVQFNYDLENIVQKQLKRHISLGKALGEETRELESLRDSLVQKKNPLGKVKITQQMFYLPGGKSTQLRGVEPDIAFSRLKESSEYGERTKPNALPEGELPEGKVNSRSSIDSDVISELRDQYLDQRSTDTKWKKYQENKEPNPGFFLQESLRLLARASYLTVN